MPKSEIVRPTPGGCSVGRSICVSIKEVSASFRNQGAVERMPDPLDIFNMRSGGIERGRPRPEAVAAILSHQQSSSDITSVASVTVFLRERSRQDKADLPRQPSPKPARWLQHSRP